MSDANALPGSPCPTCGTPLVAATEAGGDVVRVEFNRLKRQRLSGETVTLPVPGMGGSITGPDEPTVRRAIAEITAAAERRARWPRDGHAAMALLATSFPTLEGQPGTSPWDADVFLRWLCGPAPSSGMFLAGRFCLGVWNSGTRWGDYAVEEGIFAAAGNEELIEALNHFDLFRAASIWDRAHTAAALAWLDAPFFP